MAAFQQGLAALDEEGIAIAAASADDATHARGTVEQLDLRFPVGYGLPLVDTARRLGAFFEERRGILHATGFVLRPDGSIATACYATGPIGRLLPDDVLASVQFWKMLAAKARS